MYSSALSVAAPSLSAEQQQALLKPAPLVSLYQAFALVPDPRSRHGLRYDLPYLLTCLAAALLCNCNSTEAVEQWCQDHRLRLARLSWAARLLYPHRLTVSSPLTALRCASHRGGAGSLDAEQSAVAGRGSRGTRWQNAQRGRHRRAARCPLGFPFAPIRARKRGSQVRESRENQ